MLPKALSLRISRSSTAASSRSSTAVGSSRMISGGPPAVGSMQTARAISTICRSTKDRSRTRVVGSSFTPILPSAVAASRFTRGQSRKPSLSKKPSGARCWSMFSPTVRLVNSDCSWWTTPTPALNASFGPLKLQTAPLISILPSLGATMPARILRSDDLPAPFSPTRPMTSPRLISSEIPLRAVTWPNERVMSVRRRTGGASAPVSAGAAVLGRAGGAVVAVISPPSGGRAAARPPRRW